MFIIEGGLLIEFINVSKTYENEVDAIKDVSFKIDYGEFVFIISESGAGKSTLIKLLLKEIDPDKGQIILDGLEISNITRRQIPKIRRKIGVVFQDFRLLENKTVYQNVKYVMDIMGASGVRIKRRVPEVLDMVNLLDKADAFPNQLSGGEQQRVSIARAIVNSPRVLIADEPTGNLDPVTAREIMEMLVKINAKGTIVLMVTHAKDIVDDMKKRVIHLSNGLIVRDEEGGVYDEKA